MMQEIEGRHKSDENGNPAGGVTSGKGILIVWQDGPLGRGAGRQEPNGAFVEGVIGAAIDRLLYYQTAAGGRFHCAENAEAIVKLYQAISALDRRTTAREARAVEGTHTP